MDIIIRDVKANMLCSPRVEFPPTFQKFLYDNLISYKYSINIRFGDSVTFSKNGHKIGSLDLIELKMLSEEEIKKYLIKYFELEGDKKDEVD